MNPNIKALQGQLSLTQGGIRGPVTTAEILSAADDGRLQVIPSIPRPVQAGDPPWVTQMKAVYGWHETRDNAKLRAWLKSDNKTLGDPDALPWCGDAVETAVKRALPNEPLTGALAENPYYARNWALFGREARGYGAVGVFSRGATSGHVGFLVGEDDTCFHVLGGNQGDAVNVTRVEKWRLLASRWPLTYGTDPAPLPRKTSQLPVSVNEV